MTALRPFDYLRPSGWRQRIHDLATVAPLLAAVIAPLSVLLDIPALSQTWYLKNGVPQPDPKASLVLSAIGLSFNVFANSLLIIRFSLAEKPWRIATRVSTACWGVKVSISLANLITFGIVTRNKPAFSYNEGFWCAVVSCILSGIIFILLALHWCIELRTRTKKINQNVRVSGRHFMLQITLFLSLIGLGALIFSRIEHWTYLQGIYFMTVCFTTVGFGDFFPTTTAGRILLFPFTLLGIALLGSIIEMLVRFFSSRSAERKAKSRALYEKRRQEEEDKKQTPTDFAREIEFLQRLNERQDVVDQASEFALSLGGFLVFWFIGAVIFWAIEGWTYGISMYFCYVFFLSIGFGDVAPTSPGGRVVFIIYSLLAVPIMASFAVQAVTSIMTKFSSYRLDKRKAELGVETMSARNEERVISHAEFVERFEKKWVRRKHEQRAEDGVPHLKRVAAAVRDEKRVEDAAARNEAERVALAGDLPEDKEELAARVIDLAVELEMHARRLLITHLPNGSKAQVVLKADRNVQLRDVRALKRAAQGKASSSVEENAAYGAQKAGAHPAKTMRGTDGDSGSHERGSPQGKLTRADSNTPLHEERAEEAVEEAAESDAEDMDPDLVARPLDDDATMEEVRRYRESFAALLVAGSRLRGLEGHAKYMLERRKVKEEMLNEDMDHAGKPHKAEGDEDNTL
ncbi:voltage-gated potassium channel [Punctularia strigosozonata HHB-11173 SS5]|uniref:voltage-gated potassium channel n=1 Tax=Punctularia strigosozonata (strain HHB-11173) TaxID=741275 RepID=UPI0004416B89|nr:voltage-gated potassium channel [Punctularia strigosozonata HHB-11173 SS5]EIN11143.1 voltage-gated potassium channel [Punctularia strigosozonata HHB-11173 SS5]